MVNELGRLTTQLNMLLSEVYQINIHLKDAQQDLLNHAKEKRIGSVFSGYIQEHTTESESIDRQSISNTLLHTDQVLGRYSVFNTQLTSAIIGGILGGIIAVALFYLSTYLITLSTS